MVRCLSNGLAALQRLLSFLYCQQCHGCSARGNGCTESTPYRAENGGFRSGFKHETVGRVLDLGTVALFGTVSDFEHAGIGRISFQIQILVL